MEKLYHRRMSAFCRHFAYTQQQSSAEQVRQPTGDPPLLVKS